MKLSGSNVSFDESEVEEFRARGFDVCMHTPYYAIGITVALPDGTSIGFHNWLNNADCYIGDEQVHLKDEAHLDAILALMDSVVALKKFAK